MSVKVDKFGDLDSNYKSKLTYFNISHPIGATPLRGYRSASEFAENLRAPIQIPIMGAGSILIRAIDLIQQCLFFLTTFVTFDFSHAKDHGIQVINDITNMLYTVVKTIFDTIVSAVELLSRSAATVIEGVAEVFSPYMNCR